MQSIWWAVVGSDRRLGNREYLEGFWVRRFNGHRAGHSRIVHGWISHAVHGLREPRGPALYPGDRDLWRRDPYRTCPTLL